MDVFSQLLFDNYEAEATAIKGFESIGECSADDKLFGLVKPHLRAGKFVLAVPITIKYRF